MAKQTHSSAADDAALPVERAALEAHHHPSPIHSWPEFLHEIGVVVIGVFCPCSLQIGRSRLNRTIEIRLIRSATQNATHST